MKKLLLLIMSVLAFTGISLAQDVYTVGCKSVSGRTVAAVYKNGALQYNLSSSSNFNSKAEGIFVKGGNMYWAINMYNTENGNYYGTTIFKNSAHYMDDIFSNQAHINDLFGRNAIFAVGSRNVDGIRRATVWINGDATPAYTLGNSSYRSEIFCGTLGNGQVNNTFAYFGGVQYDGTNSYHGVIWRELQTSEFITFPSGTAIYDIKGYLGDIYAVGLSYEDGTIKVKVWKNNTLLWTIQENYGSSRLSLSIDAGDVYVSAYEGTSTGSSKPDRVWKNGVATDYSTPGTINRVVANSKGVYYSGYQGGSGKVWKDGEILYDNIQCDNMYDMFVTEPTCSVTEPLSLPFFDGFEKGNTYWPCWTKIDVDNTTTTDLTYWARAGRRECTPKTGDYAALHRKGSSDQEGWLITPSLFLQPRRDYTTLTFDSWRTSGGYCGVLVSTNSDPTNTSSYTEVWSSSTGNGTWSEISVNLSAYRGKSVYIAFKYSGTNAHNWEIDNVKVEEGWNPCGGQSVPYTENYNGDYEPGICWYVLDNDHSNNSCWEHYSSTDQECMVHYTGPSGVAQEDWAFSPRINLPSGEYNYSLSFRSGSTGSLASSKKNTLWIAVDPSSGTPDLANFTTKIWEDSHYSGTWFTESVDLSAYKGHQIMLGFKYEGTASHAWWVDDVNITQAVTEYTITASSNNNSYGTVTGGGTYPSGSSCTLIATPAEGYLFQGWKKNGTLVNTQANWTFPVTESATYVGYFGSIPTYTIETAAVPETGGTVTGGGTFQENSSITLEAIPNAGFYFDHWGDGNTENPRTITVTANATYTAYFTMDEYSINVYANPTDGGAVSGTGTYHYGAEVEISATPAEGYNFAGWDDANTDNPRTIIVTGDANYTAIFSEVGVQYYTVMTNVSPMDAGAVEGGGTYEEGTTIVLTAIANPGFTFDHWDDDVTSNPRTITVDHDMSFMAVFNVNNYVITVVADPVTGGSVSGGGSYTYGETAVLTANPYSGYDFVGWSDGSSENPHNVTVTESATYTATFSAAGGSTYYTVTGHVSPSGAGFVDGVGTYEEGSSVTLTAVANEGYTFHHWNDGVTQNPRIITVNNNMSFTAYFDVQQYTITVNATPAAGGTVTGGGTYTYGASAVLTATPNANYSFMQWNDGNISNPRTVTVTGNATYSALFLTEGGETYTLTLGVNNPFLGSVHGGGTYPAGSSVEINAYPSMNSRFVKWSDNNTDNPRTIIMDSDKSLTAEFAIMQQFEIVVESADAGMGNAFGSGTYNEGDQIEITASAFSGYIFKRWNDNNTDNPRTITVTGNATYTAYFEENNVVTHMVTLICNTEEGSVSGGGQYVAGTTATLQAFPKEGFAFDRWNDGNTDNPRTITVNEDITLVAFFKSTGVDETDMNALSIYPNPATNSIRIEGLEGNRDVQIYNALGEIVKSVNVNADQEIGIEELASGIYMVRCGKQSLRFVKQ